MTLRFEHRAMATLFELWMVGHDAAFLQSIAFQVWTELDRLELLLSRFDERAEVARINREAKTRPVRVEIELFNILKNCQHWCTVTKGHFNVCMAPVQSPKAAMVLDEKNRTVFLEGNACFLDLGGYGKGYALDVMARVIKDYGVDSAFVQGGTSSALAWGENEAGQWSVNVTHHMDNQEVLINKELSNSGFSYSATNSPCSRANDIVNPSTGEHITHPGACWVIAPTALQAEVLTTAALAAGVGRARQFVYPFEQDNLEVGWV